MLRVHVLSRVYTVTVGKLNDGQWAIDDDRREIQLDCPPTYRAEALIDAVTSRMSEELVRDADPRRRARIRQQLYREHLNAAAASVMRDLRGDGLLKLQMLAEDQTQPATFAVGELTEVLSGTAAGSGYQCPECGQAWAAGNVRCSRSKVAVGGAVVYCGAECGDGCEWGCGKIIVWTEPANEAGRPMGGVIGEHQVLTGDDAAEFRRLHRGKLNSMQIGDAA